MPRAEHPSTPMQDLEARRNWAGPVLGGVLTQEIVDFCQCGLSVVLGTRRSDGRPIAGLALACRIDAEGAITIFLRGPANGGLLQALSEGAAVAATFTLPRNHRSIQIKGGGARRVPCLPGDLELVERQATGMRDELENGNYPPRFAAYYCAYREDEIEAIEFMPKKAFVQTPGLGAGERARSMTPLKLEAIRDCFEGFVPSVIATCDVNGVPNVSMLSQVHYVDPGRVALSYQFFNKTRRNMLSTASASVAVVDPVTMAQYRLDLTYEETQTSGPVFESMKAKLAGIASHTGMHGVFHLLGSDIYRVVDIEPIPVQQLPPAPAERNLLAATRATCAALSRCRELGELCDRTLDCLQQHFGIKHALIMMLDETEAHLYTVASRGYPHSGIGSEVSVGDGVIGVAARENVPIRIGHMSSDYSYHAAVRDTVQPAGTEGAATEIPFPGLRKPESQIAVPIIQCGKMIGVLFGESLNALAFGYDDQDGLAIVADQFGAIFGLMRADESPAEIEPRPVPVIETDDKLTVRYYPADGSVFLNRDYLIKGVAGAIFWKIVTEYVRDGRTEFTNRELRLDPALRLPAFAENLEARLVLLHRRLAERSRNILIEKCGRGRFRLVAPQELLLEEIDSAPSRKPQFTNL